MSFDVPSGARIKSIVRSGLFIVTANVSTPVFATDPDSLTNIAPPRCFWYRSAAIGGAMAGTLVLLDQAWYSDYSRTSFHTFNDGHEWLGMDKAGHIFSAYTLGAWGHKTLAGGAAKDKAALWVGGSAGLVFLTGVELLDGTSAAWGFSWWDMVANVAGTGLYLGQELGWKEQRVMLKLSARHTEFAALRPELLGTGPVERYLKDYNGQTLWASFNLRAFMPRSGLPPWLNVALGHGATGMITAGPPGPNDTPSIPGTRYRRVLLAPDLDLTRIPTRSKALRTVFFVLNSIKVPTPALEFSTGRFRGHWLYF